MTELCVSSPLFGPFVEANGITGEGNGGTQLGATISWSSALGAMSVHLLRSNGSTYWREILSFDELPGIRFSEVFDALFQISPRLFDFLNELTPFIHPSQHAPLHAKAFDWLNPELSSLGYAVGKARTHRLGVTAPLVWVFRKAEVHKVFGTASVGVNYLEWREGSVSLRQGGWVNCSDYPTAALRRYVLKAMTLSGFALLSPEGEERMRELYNNNPHQKLSSKPKTSITDDESTTLSTVRILLKSDQPIPSDLLNSCSKLSEKSFINLLRSAIRSRSETAFKNLITLKTLQGSTLCKLLDKCIDEGLTANATLLLALGSILPELRPMYIDALLCRAVCTGERNIVEWAVNTSELLTVNSLHWTIRKAAEDDSYELLRFLIHVIQTKHLADEALLEAFSSDIMFQQWDAAEYWIKLGLRPFEVSSEKEYRLHEMMKKGGLPVLKAVFSSSPVNEENLRRVLQGCIHGGSETTYVLNLSRKVKGHTERMSEMMPKWIRSYLQWGHLGYSDALILGAKEGGTLLGSEQALSQMDLLKGHQWKLRQSRLIDLVGRRQKEGFPNEAAIAAGIKRNSANVLFEACRGLCGGMGKLTKRFCCYDFLKVSFHCIAHWSGTQCPVDAFSHQSFNVASFTISWCPR